jgi:hypothetical protein
MLGMSLQDAVDQASPGSTLFVPAGVYTEPVVINKPLVVVGADSNQTINQTTSNEPVLRVTSSDVTIMNMKISGSAGYGIELVDSSPSSPRNIQINRVVFENNAQGGVLIQGFTGGSPINYTIENNTFIGGATGTRSTCPKHKPILRLSVIIFSPANRWHRFTSFLGRQPSSIKLNSFDDWCRDLRYELALGSISAVSQASMTSLFDLDSLFVDAANGDYQLSAGSPAIDAGDPSLVHETFYDGDNDGIIRIDIGAFESKPLMISGNLGIDGAILSYIDGCPRTATTDANGNYSHGPFMTGREPSCHPKQVTYLPPSVSYKCYC